MTFELYTVKIESNGTFDDLIEAFTTVKPVLEDKVVIQFFVRREYFRGTLSWHMTFVYRDKTEEETNETCL